MIQSIAGKYKKHIAYPLFFIFYFQTILLPLHAAVNSRADVKVYNKSFIPSLHKKINTTGKNNFQKLTGKDLNNGSRIAGLHSPEKLFIGGPSSPEASSFKAVGSDNLVNLFTGDFSYSIPLLDVGGYPVNLFYNGGITMEQEASWVGLGWNINPGTVNRNMRGVPDDFDGTDTLIQTQNVKPNRTWGGEVGLDGELLGAKTPRVNLSLGFSVNNYLGPAMELGAGISLGIPLLESSKSEKGVGSNDLDIGLNTKLSSRSGLTFSPSLNLNLPLRDNNANIGVGLSTSYNSRTGIKELNLSSQVSVYHFLKKTEGSADPEKSFISGSIGSSSISFARPTYIPTLRMPMEYSNYSGQLELGGGMFGYRFAAQAQGYYSESKVPAEFMVIYKPLVGFMHSENASANKDAVMDFNRLNDAEVTPNTPIISAPQYAYDIFSIQGEGTGGTIRAYRGDLGYMRDNETTSKDNNFSIGFDIAPPGHYGGNWNTIQTPTRVGGWEDANNTLKQTMSFGSREINSKFENVYFRNPGEVTVTNPELLNRIGGDNLVRFKLSGSDVNPRLESTLEQFNKKTLASKGEISIDNGHPDRDKRTQVTTMLTAQDAAAIGLEKQIRNYSGTFDTDNNIQYSQISRTGGYRKSHHISEINVLEQSGMRYVYGIPVYSIKQKDFTFSVDNTGDPATGIASFTSDEPTVGSHHMANKDKLDGYVMTQETPAYASSFLLTGLISPDYVDVKNDGITEDDLGNAVKFDYNKSDDVHKWRTPRGSQGNIAHFNEGLKSEKKDNKATISYGEREVWYLNSIESKSMVAIFKTEARDDGKGVISDLNGAINQNENANKRLKQIDLYTKAEIKAKGIANARPIKTVHFEYDYSMCPGTPDNKNGGGKLTLKSVYFSYNGQSRAIKNKYVFDYGDASMQSNNPSYANNASDRWGTYKNPDINSGTNPAANPSGLYNTDYPYTSQNKAKNDQFAAAWTLKRILLPSGGQMEVQYEADDYAYVQDRRACNMFSVYGFGNTKTALTDNGLYKLGSSSIDNNYVYIQLTQPLQASSLAEQKKEIFDKYLQTLNQIAFRLLINMPNGPEALTVYANYDDYGLCSNSSGKDIIYLKLTPVDGESPLSKSAIGFITENLPDQAFPGYEIDADGVEAFLDMLGNMLGSLKNPFKNVDQQMRSNGRARTIVLNKSFARLANPSKIKYGGGVRVKQILVRDNWNKMKGNFASTYGQDYDYTTTENINGTETVISSGVASYEPGIGSEENPFREIVSFNNKMPLASAQYGAIEMPMLEGLYPSPVVGYSKVTIRSIHRNGTHGDTTVRSAIGKQVTEFYTAKDYPTYSNYTPLSDKEYHYNSFLNLLYKQVNDRRVVSQGFLVETNDMHGKMKSQKAFSESDEKTPLSYSYHTYKNTGKNGLNDVVDFVNSEQGGTVSSGNMGIDVELMTDVREFKAETNGFNGQIQTDFFSFFPPIFLIPMLPIRSYTENKYRAVTTTKLINYHAIEDSVIVMDKGSVISTKTIAFDRETGTPVVTKTGNEFNDPVYNVSYPAYWAYSGMGLAYKNIGYEFSGVNFNDGKIQGNSINQNDVFESGDELYLTVPGSGSQSCIPESANVTKLWAYDKNKNVTGLTVTNKDLIFIDSAGVPFTKSNVGFRIVRSGKRNLLANSVASVMTMGNPIVAGKLTINSDSKAVTASAMEFREKWQADNDVFRRLSFVTDSTNCSQTEIEDCNGYLESKINPYVKGLIGNFRDYRSLVFYDNRAEQSTSANSTAIRTNGYLSDFSHYWNFNTDNNLIPDFNNPKWVWNSQNMKYNSKGLQLENKDALNIYTSAQYGFNKTQPVAVAKNSRYQEMFGESFEDYTYNESINPGTNNNCTKRHFDLSTLPGSAIINTDSMPFNAHTGRNVLQLNSGATISKEIDVNTGIDTFNLYFGRDSIISLVNTGGNVTDKDVFPLFFNSTDQSQLVNVQFDNFNSVGMQDAPISNIWLYDSATSTQRYYSGYELSTQQYVKVTACRNYRFVLNVQHDNTASGGDNDAEMVVDIRSLDGNLIKEFQCGDFDIDYSNTLGGGYSSTTNDMVFLPEGIYSIEAEVNFYHNHFGDYTTDFGFDSKFSFGTDMPGPSYRDLGNTSCYFQKPVAASDSMLNPEFSLTSNKKMLFSAWVRENCGTPCTKLTYAENSVELDFGDGHPTILNPSGTIIEGWQKVEGEFTPPADATNMIIRFVNTGSAPSYWDDIRIHPFNANMKTYTYDSRNLRLAAELDENNYASFYEYDEEGQLVRVKKETSQGIKTINETRSAKQKIITDLQ